MLLNVITPSRKKNPIILKSFEMRPAKNCIPFNIFRWDHTHRTFDPSNATLLVLGRDRNHYINILEWIKAQGGTWSKVSNEKGKKKYHSASGF